MGNLKHTLASEQVHRTLPTLLRLPLVGLTWLLVCLLVLWMALIVLVSRLVQTSFDALLQIVRA